MMYVYVGEREKKGGEGDSLRVLWKKGKREGKGRSGRMIKWGAIKKKKGKEKKRKEKKKGTRDKGFKGELSVEINEKDRRAVDTTAGSDWWPHLCSHQLTITLLSCTLYFLPSFLFFLVPFSQILVRLLSNRTE
jgi:hypothetical protein